jgi:hypothetical protein
VEISRTQEVIKKLLKKYNLQGIRFTEYGRLGIIEFILLEDGKEMTFRFKFDLPEKPAHQRQVYRAIFFYLKARFSAIEFGISTVEKEFLQELVLKLPDGSNKTVKEIAEEKGLINFKSNDLLLPFKER